MHPAVSIHWPNDKKRIDKVLRTGIIPSDITPRQLMVPGGKIALVDDKQDVMLIGKIQSIDTDVEITDWKGKKRNGRNLIMQKASLRRPGKRDHKRLAVSKHLGRFFYLDENMGPVNRSGGGTVKVPQEFYNQSDVEFQRFNGEQLAKPERDLILRYQEWIGDYEKFLTPTFESEGIRGDLFIPRFYCLVEAKAYPQRDDMRKAIGQLFDYQHCYKTRKPSLAYLVTGKPRKRDIDLLLRINIATIWETKNGKFGDSLGGKYTTEFRKVIRARS